MILRSMMKKTVLICLYTLCLYPALAHSQDIHIWNNQELSVLRSLWIESLPPLPADPSNKYADNTDAAILGKKLFFDTRISKNKKVSCASCHVVNKNFADNLPLAKGIGTTTRRTMPLIGVAYNTWFFWDGSKDNLWSQALGPIESSVEHGFTRTQAVMIIAQHYKNEYEKIFGQFPDLAVKEIPKRAKPEPHEPIALKKWMFMSRENRIIVNHIYARLGKAIAAYVRTLLPTASRFDQYVEAAIKKDKEAMQNILTAKEANGLRLFIGRAKCINCHTGPLFTNGDFHHVGAPRPSNLPIDRGRADAISKVLADEFNCLSVYSDAKPDQCYQLRFIDTNTRKYIGAFKTPSLRNVAERAPYMHAGQFSTLRDVLEFYRLSSQKRRSPDLEHGSLSDKELDQLNAFLQTLTGK